MTDAIPIARSFRSALLACAGFALVMPAIPAFSQDTLAEARIRKMEAEIRALQRKVFPGGDGKFFAPEITPQDASSGSAATGQPATSAVTDILTRMDALEAQLARLTSLVEQNTNRIAELETRAPAAAPAAAATAVPPATDEPEGLAAPAAAQANLDAMTGGASKPVPAPAAAPAQAAAPKPPSNDRVRAVSAIVKPQTDDPADDEYSYGFRLWDAKFYPEAQQQLKLFLEKHPSHWRASWGRNLLGRAYLDDGNPREAAKWFLQNYQSDKAGGRAPDSLLYLAGSMKQLKDDKRACIALAEFSETYAAEAAGRLKGPYDAIRNGLDCSG
jgi:TolA-binding protein